MNTYALFFLIIFTPISTALFLFLIPKKIKFVHEFLSFLASLTALMASIFLFLQPKIEINYLIFNLGKINFNFNLLTNSLNVFLLLFTTGFGLFITLYSFKYMALNSSKKKYYIFLLITIGSASCVLLANHLLLLYDSESFFVWRLL